MHNMSPTCPVFRRLVNTIFLIICIVWPLASEATPEDLKKGLVAYLPFDNCTAKDMSKHGNKGTLVGHPTCVPGVQGQAFYLNGLDQYIKIAKPKGLYFNPNKRSFSLVTWAKPIRINQFEHDPPCLLDWVPLFDDYRYFLGSNGIEAKRSWLDQGGAYTKPIFDVEVWHLFAGTWEVIDGKAIASFYLDGTLRAQEVYDTIRFGQYPKKIPLIGATHHCTINGLSLGETYVDQIRVYKRSLSPHEIAEIYDLRI